jgi:hypothetical protein
MSLDLNSKNLRVIKKDIKMKGLLNAILLIGIIGHGAAYAHQDHHVINSEDAINIANKSVKQLTFKDFGYRVGKLDTSWKSLNESHFRVLEVLDKTYIISATNATNNKVIYFEITKNGKVLSVNDVHQISSP